MTRAVSLARARFGALLFCFAALMTGASWAKPVPLPAYLGFPREIPPPSADNSRFEIYGEAEFHPDPAVDEPTLQRGRHWFAGLAITGMSDETPGRDVWARIKPGMVKAGWRVMAEYDVNPPSATLHLQKPGTDAWANITFFGTGDIRLDVVEIAPPAVSLALAAPAATPERIAADHGDFPYLPPLPGAKFSSGRQDNAPMLITLPGSDEPQAIGTGTISKYYDAADGNSNLLFVTLYHDALLKAGWTVIDQSQGPHQSDATITAHYAKGGRDIWAALHGTPGDIGITVADIGSRDLGSELARTCHVALYGVLFDFDKATLKSESDAVLGRVQAMLAKDASLKIEVQGHTDAVGNDAYNVTLSNARAGSVMAWLVQHGIAGDRMTSKGYGKTMPVATNETDEGRARNRRVEVAKPGCKPK